MYLTKPNFPFIIIYCIPLYNSSVDPCTIPRGIDLPSAECMAAWQHGSMPFIARPISRYA